MATGIDAQAALVAAFLISVKDRTQKSVLPMINANKDLVKMVIIVVLAVLAVPLAYTISKSAASLLLAP